ncbi:hypothetical protein Q1695_005923 [Nippostrongylus brasiliensis]|nr:hypothetical protein Q1695_005923 [Nippostrongylus brasiliensis]
MSANSKRRRQEHERTDSSILTFGDDGRTPVDFVSIDEEELRVSLEPSRSRDIDAAVRLLRGLCALLNHRWNTSMKKSVLFEFARCLAKHNIPFDYNWSVRSAKYLCKEEFCGKYVPWKNLNMFLRDLSELEHNLRAALWGFHNVYFGCTPLRRLLGGWNCSAISLLRYQLCRSGRSANYRAVAAVLANSEVLRMVSELVEQRREGQRALDYNMQRDIYFDSPIAIFMALQTTLSLKHDSSFNLGNRLLVLATMQSLVYTTTAAQNTIMMQLCEFLICVMLCGTLEDVAAVVALENSIHRYNKSYENTFVWNAYKLMVDYEQWRERGGIGGMIANTAQSLLAMADLLTARGVLFVETACRIWAKLGRNEEKISEAVSTYLSKAPQLVGRLTTFLKAIDFDHEVEIAVEKICNAPDSALCHSDGAWLDWCQPRIERPERYGARSSVLSRCVTVLFRFLDYGSNRGSDRAWILLHTAVQFVDRDLFVTLWGERCDWWHRFHTVPLLPEADCKRQELLDSLGSLTST